LSFSKEYVVSKIKEILSETREGLRFEEVRDRLESTGIYVDGYILRKIVAEMVREKVICKEVSPTKRKLLLRLCDYSQRY